ncbi:MAG: tetratricopeptide repeat protein [Caldilineales bacterium]|nr:tetratricopeptide repeat protein [Caldilineales bacterium]
MELPAGTITFLLSDIENSTLLWERFAEAMRPALARHDEIIDQGAIACLGTVVRPRGEGDSRFVVFEHPLDAVNAAIQIQRALAAEFKDSEVSIKVRIGIHTGASSMREGDYYGSSVNRCARIRGLGHGGQTLLSETTAGLVRASLPDGIDLIDMGSHKLKGLDQPETVFQVWIADLPNEFPPLQSDDVVVNNLPVVATALIGREHEIAGVADLLQRRNVRLITLTGVGGAGKTRLCLEIAQRQLQHFPHGVFFVDLSPITDPALTASTIARAIGIREGGGRPPLDNLKDYLANKEMLLVLDNFEQIISGVALVSQLLAAAPKIKVLTTSRIALLLREEYEFPVLPLAVPENVTDVSVDAFMEYASIRLFVERAQAIQPSFRLTPVSAEAVLGICRRLDGLPLAIEIAAARIRVLPPQAMLKRLDQSLKLLVGGAADLPTRQQTLYSAINWSYNLLEPNEQSLFTRLGVFVGGFTLDAAEGVCNAAGELDVLNGVETLIRNNLVRQAPSVSEEPRFDLLVTIREFALEKLHESGALAELAQRHAEYFARLSQVAGDNIYGRQSTDWLRLVDQDYDNFRTALHYWLTHENGVSSAVHMCINLFWFWYRYGHIHEGREWTDRLIEVTMPIGGPPYAMSLAPAALMAMWEGDLIIAAERARVSMQILEQYGSEQGLSNGHFFSGVILINQGKDTEAYAHLSTAAELFDQGNDLWNKGTALVHMANAALGLGETEQALAMLDRAMPIAREIGDPWQIAFCLNNYGEVARAKGEYEKAEEFYRQTEEQYRVADARGDHARLLNTLAFVALHHHEFEKAEVLFHQSLSDYRELGNKRGVAESLAGLAGLAVLQDHARWAVPLFSAASTLLESFGAAWWPADRLEHERTLRIASGQLTANEYATLWESGSTMNIEQAIAYAMAGHYA